MLFLSYGVFVIFKDYNILTAITQLLKNRQLFHKNEISCLMFFILILIKFVVSFAFYYFKYYFSSIYKYPFFIFLGISPLNPNSFNSLINVIKKNP